MRFFWIFLFPIALFSIDLNLPVSAIQNAANGLALPIQYASITAIHPALENSGVETGVTYLYSITDLPYYLIHINYRWKNMGFYFGNERIQHPLYKENQTHFAMNYHYRNLHFGLQTRYLNNEVKNYDKCSIFVIDAGIAYNSNKFLSTFSLKNIFQSNLYNLSLPVFYVYEIKYDLFEKSSLFLGIEKQESYDFIFRGASTYQLFPFFSLLTSYQYEPQRIGFGIDVSLEKWAVIYSVRTHQYLKLTHYISVCYDFSP